MSDYSASAPSDTSVAIVGMACRYPSVDGLAAFWQLLIEGRSTVGRFTPRSGTDPAGRDTPDLGVLQYGSFFEAIDGFDATFFAMTPQQAAATDPVVRLGLELAWEAVEDARYDASALAGHTIDVIVGAAPSGYEALRRRAGADLNDHYAALGSSGALVANRISQLLDVRGLSLCADTGQSSSLVGLVMACDRLVAGLADAAIVGGVNLIVDPATGLPLANLGVLSAEGRCFAFDERANGFVRGEGGAFVLVKRLADAVAAGDRIYAVVHGWAAGNNGATAQIPDPSPEGQAATLCAALRRAGLTADDLEYMETHGTGTRRGDPSELAGLRMAQGARTPRNRLPIGSVKTNLGHLEPAAGITGLIKTALCVHHRRLVPSLNFRSPTRAFPDFDRRFVVPVETTCWTGTGPRRAGVSAFGLGGTNAHAVLAEAPATATRTDHRPPPIGTATGLPTAPGTVPWVVSARSGAALRAQARRLLEHTRDDDTGSITDIAHSLATRRHAHTHRAVVVGADRATLRAGLVAVADTTDVPNVVRGQATSESTSVVFVFPGQGTQWSGMGARMLAESPVFADAVDDCARALRPWIDWSLVDVLVGAPDAASIDRVDVVQPALFSMMVALARVWMSWGVVPHAVVGHSQGEIAAAHVAGALPLTDAARIVARRSTALAGIDGHGGMLALAASADDARARVQPFGDQLSLAAVNGPRSTVVAGDRAALERFAAEAATDGIDVRRLPVSYASHSPHVDDVRAAVLDAVGDVSPRPTDIAFHSTVVADRVDTTRLDAGYWFDNLRSTVRFADAVETLLHSGHSTFVEIGPHPVLGAAIQDTADQAGVGVTTSGSLRRGAGTTADLMTELGALHCQGTTVDWRALFSDGAASVDLPTYAFQRRSFWVSAPESCDLTPDDGGIAATDLNDERAVHELVFSAVASVLRTVSQAELRARPTTSFRDLGMDSASAVELRNRLGAATGMRLAATVAFSYPTLSSLSSHLSSLLTAPAGGRCDEADPTGADPPAMDDDRLYELIDRGYE
ncbi:acyltransferase domain-containing protein [Pseudonocardia sp. ICBG1122]|nr:acyltransferase domain-containing protein [Pseudonocardia pini]